MAALLCFKPKHLYTGNRKNTRWVFGCCKEHGFTNLSKVPPAYTNWESSSETKVMGTTLEHRRPFLGSNFQTLCVQSWLKWVILPTRTGLQQAPQPIMNLSRLRTFDTESVTDQITTLSYFWIHGDIILAFLRARLEDDSQGCQHAEATDDVFLRGWHSPGKNSWDPETWTT